MFKSQDFKDIVLVDFGISNFYKDNENQKIFGLTAFYCAPEIKYSNLSLLTPKADIFSFGMLIIYYCNKIYLEYYMKLPLSERLLLTFSQKHQITFIMRFAAKTLIFLIIIKGQANKIWMISLVDAPIVKQVQGPLLQRH